LTQKSGPDSSLLEVDFDRVIQNSMDADGAPEQRMENIACPHHQELAGLSLRGYPFCTKTQEAIIPPRRFMADRRLRFFVHMDGDLPRQKYQITGTISTTAKQAEGFEACLFFLT
jgi:hypothetical protein